MRSAPFLKIKEMNILITGANGQLGNEMRIVTKDSKDKYIFTDVVEAKISVKACNINKNWVICLLLAIVIALVAIVCVSSLFNSDKVAMIISFTATILSIVLSLLAIIYTYLGNIESSGNLSEIRSAVSEIKATEDAIKGFVSNIVTNMGNLADNHTTPTNEITKDNIEVKTSNNSQSKGQV